ncbi:MAG: PHP domain-containing protein [Candidatus Hydrothermia bacterium]|nr:PHP domain-containing protein [Candidatus Hydrothermia bacterium]
MMRKCDLHTHTNKSDGIYSPKDLVYFLYSKGIKVLSITDHDSIEALPEAREETQKLGMDLIPGIELSAEYLDEEVHILGYFIDADSPSLSEYLMKFRLARRVRFSKMIEKLKKMGIEVPVDLDSYEEEKAIGRPHLARALLERGYVSSFEEAFQKYIGDNGPAYVKKFKIYVEDAIEIVHESGGVSILAHPGLLNRKDEVINLSISKGIDGIEVYHPKNSHYIEEQLTEIAFKNNLMVTGGTDFHGDFNDQEYIANIELYCETEGKRMKVIKR